MNKLSQNKHYLQIALNLDLDQAEQIINTLPPSERILLEAGTPLIKEAGADGIRRIVDLWQRRLVVGSAGNDKVRFPFVVADLKVMDRGDREVQIAAQAGASAAVALGLAPIPTLDVFVEACNQHGLTSMIDMMNVELPHKILPKLRTLPDVVILHRGVDEERLTDKRFPIHLINKIKGYFDVMVSVAGGDTPREIQSAVFNGADIVVLWKNFYQAGADTGALAEEFLQEIK